MTIEGMGYIKNSYKQREIKKCYTTSTFLVPEPYIEYFNQQCKLHGSRRRYLSFIVANYLPEINLFKKKLEKRRNPKWKTDYQKKGLDLERRNFIPEPDDWEEFRNFAWAFGVSMCFLFVFLLELEMKGYFQKKGKNKVLTKTYKTHRFNSIQDNHRFWRSKLSRDLNRNMKVLMRLLLKE